MSHVHEVLKRTANIGKNVSELERQCLKITNISFPFQKKSQIFWAGEWPNEKLKGFGLVLLVGFFWLVFFPPILGIISNATSYPIAEGKFIASKKITCSPERNH